MSSKLDRLLGIIEAYAELAAGWIPSEEDDYEEFKSALEAVLSAPQGMECQHSWVTDGINPTCCSKCKRPAMPTHPTERK